jgi:glyoxylase-like metal-dependent hydrolase (beta-lactamase superfamily II)
MPPFVIHTHTAAVDALAVNSYLLTTAEGAVLIDSSLLVADAEALAERIAASGVPLRAVFVTHAHPDHFNGLPFVAGDDVPVYAARQVAETIGQIAEPKRQQWQPVYGTQWPATYRVPDHPLPDGTTITAAGLTVTVHAVGSAESHADSYLTVNSADDSGTPVAFIGDLAFHGTHSYVADGHTGTWLTVLDRLERELAGATLYPGHGGPGGPGMFSEQRRYLMMYREVVTRLGGGASRLSDDQRTELTDTMSRFLPGAPLEWMIGLGADAVAGELAASEQGRSR